ncbi:MAG: hypothetical protein H6Q73_134 [Firmicutes bacterium]|nr:hypothetical protein [Bacillota bacterium]
MRLQPLLAVARVAATYAGTLIGAGFASGQEISQFFASYGSAGLLGIGVSTILFAWLGTFLLELGYQLKASAYSPVIYHICGRHLGIVIDFITSIFLFITLAIMLAGAATVLHDYLGLAYLTGLALAAVIVIVTVAFGVNGISTANLIIAPLLILSILFISGYSLLYHSFTPNMLQTIAPVTNPATPHWLLGSLLYASYNLVMGATVLVPLGAYVTSRKVRRLGGLAGGIVLGLIAAFLAVVLLIHYPAALKYEVPILQIAAAQYKWSSAIYSYTLLAAMYTTAIASLYGCSVKVTQTTKINSTTAILIITILALVFSNLGFAALIRLMFPLFGYATLFFTFRLAWVSFRGIR